MSQSLAPRLGVTGARLDLLAKALDETCAETAAVFKTTPAAVAIAAVGVLAALLGKIDRAAAADFFHALSAALKNGADSADLDRRRIDRTAAALYEADQRRPSSPSQEAKPE